MTEPSPDLIARAFDLVPVITGRSRQETARIIARFAQDALDAQAETLAVAHRDASVQAFERGVSKGQADVRAKYRDLITAAHWASSAS